MTDTTQTNLFQGFNLFEGLLPKYAQTGIFNPAAQNYVRGSASRPLATVQSKKVQTADTTSFVLQPPAGYPSFKAGQHIDVAVEINGVRTLRQYSLTGLTSATTLAITVKRAGKVSNFLHDQIAPGARFEISLPRGEFLAPKLDHSAYLFFSAGSGITPVYAMVCDLLAKGAWGDIHFFHAAKDEVSVIFHDELKRLAALHDNFHPHFFFSGAERLSVASAIFGNDVLAADSTRAVHPPHTPVRICGAGEFVSGIEADLKTLMYSDIQSEYYTLPAREATEGEVFFTRAQKTVKADSNLLEVAEAAGLKPKHGCRRGICHECKAHKTSGAVKNILTGIISEGKEDIQLCISEAVGKVEINL